MHLLAFFSSLTNPADCWLRSSEFLDSFSREVVNSRTLTFNRASRLNASSRSCDKLYGWPPSRCTQNQMLSYMKIRTLRLALRPAPRLTQRPALRLALFSSQIQSDWMRLIICNLNLKVFSHVKQLQSKWVFHRIIELLLQIQYIANLSHCWSCTPSVTQWLT